MNIKKDLTGLPQAESQPYTAKAAASTEMSLAPLRTPVLATRLAHQWYESRTHDDDLPHALADAGWYRGSYAGTCSRTLMYRRAGTTPTDPSSIADHWRMDLGSMVHEHLQDAITKVMPDAKHEVKVDLNLIGIPGSMHIDTVRPVDDAWETVEIKTINGFGFKKSAAKFSGGPEGPRDSAVIQAALGALSYAAQTGEPVVGARLVYLSLECVSPKLAEAIGEGGEEARFSAEWFIPWDDCVQIVAREKYRLDMLEADLQSGDRDVQAIVTTRTMETYGSYVHIVNPSTGAAIDDQGNGTRTWQCDYCDFQSICISEYQVQS